MKTFYTVDVLSGNETDFGVDTVRANFGNGYIELMIRDGALEVRGMSPRRGSIVVQPVVTNVIHVRLK